MTGQLDSRIILDIDNCLIVGGSRQVEVWSTKPLQLQVKGNENDWQKELRRNLKEALQEIQCDHHMLKAAWWHDDDITRDLENVLIYNVGEGAFKHAARRLELKLQRDDPTPKLPQSSKISKSLIKSYSRYEAVDGASGFPQIFAGVEVDGEISGFSNNTKTWEIWRAVHKGRVKIIDDKSLLKTQGVIERSKDLALKLTLYLGENCKAIHPAKMVKRLVDGMMCALHAHYPEGNNPKKAEERKAQRGVVHGKILKLLARDEHNSIEAWLYNSNYSVLGRHRFVFPRGGDGLQWSPKDDYLTWISVELVEGRKSGEFHARMGTISSDTAIEPPLG